LLVKREEDEKKVLIKMEQILKAILFISFEEVLGEITVHATSFTKVLILFTMKAA
jgi:hypothetical protein